MTNTQQTILGQVSVEQPQEEVHFTELKPVEQSRLVENGDIDDNGTTDGLKALRSYSQAPTGNFEIHEFDFSGKVNRYEPEKTFEHLTVKGKCERWKDVTNNLDGIQVCLEETRKTPAKVNKTVISKTSPRKRKIDQNGKSHKGSILANFNDKVPQLTTQLPSKESPKKKSRRKTEPRKRVKEFTVPKVQDYPAKEIGKKIDAIIQANYLLEQENNNVVENTSENQNQTSKDSNVAADLTKKYRCMMCNARFKGSGGLRNHYKVIHSSGPLFKCDECGKEFPLKERLKLHVRTHTGFKPYKCSECDKSFARGGQLVQHRRTHSQVKPYRCNLCSGTFTCAANLALHLKRHNGQKDHKCEICGRGFVRRDALKKHLECLHRDVKSFLCVICNKTFKGHLPQHMRTHAKDRPHGCATCGQRFAQKSQLTVHQRTHSGQRPFRCLVCWQAFAHSTALKLHTRRHTGERPFKCIECNAGFTQLPHWKKHMKCIHGRNEPYCCSKCKTFFRIKNDLEAHEKDCHPTESAGESSSENGNTSESPDSGDKVLYNKHRVMSIEKMRLLLAVLLKRISKPERLEELGFGKRLIDEVLEDSLVFAGKGAAKSSSGTGINSEFEALRKNLGVFLEWTVPKGHWENFRKLKKTPEEILETLTAT